MESETNTVAERAASVIESKDKQRDQEREVSPSSSDNAKSQYVDLEMGPHDRSSRRHAPFYRKTTEKLLENGIVISGVQEQENTDYDYRVWFNEISLSNGEMSFDYDG